ncbi:MAG: thermonuclease family protein [Pseudomonadota bacterium]
MRYSVFGTLVLFVLGSSALGQTASLTGFDTPRVMSGVPEGTRLAGLGTMVDGDTLRLNGHLVRLAGIDAPEAEQLCELRYGVAYPCGAAASAFMAEIVAEGPVECQALGRDRFGRILARCWQGTHDIGADMVRAGHALAYVQMSQVYLPQQEAAKHEKLGLWRGRFTPPWAFRQAQASAYRSDPSRPDCSTKANRKTKTMHNICADLAASLSRKARLTR